MLRFASLLLVLVFVSVQSSPTPSTKDIISSLISFDRNEDMPTIEYERTFSDLPNVLYTIKLQFKEILEELFTQVFTYILSVMKQLKLKLLRNLGFITLADIAEGVMNLISNLIVEPVVEVENEYMPIRMSPSLQTRYDRKRFSVASTRDEEK
ncbi:unnamed protein product [Diatraea saccharalis]|uniref:Uncharacterized protein n=1 Tax=Diatraea saccharalis TaxID=40085 RepID=A0A9N9R111_9NEOP|nr:unnamed protein product [Diatraea saccharalis]